MLNNSELNTMTSCNITPHTIKNEIKGNLSLSIPLITSQLIYACSGFVGTAMVAHLGEKALAASILVSMVWMSLSMFFFGVLNSVSVLISHQYGAKNYKTINDIMGQSFLLGVFIAVTLIIILLSLPWMMQWSKQPLDVLHLANQYIYSLLWTIPGLVALVICEQFLAGINRTKLVLRISLLVVPVEIPLIYLLIFGQLGFPRCGIAGVGYGFAITYTLSAILLILYLLKSKQFKLFTIFSGINTIHFHYIFELLRIGIPMGLMHVIEVSAFAVATFWIAQFGTTLLAAHQIVIQYLNFTITIVFAMSQAVTIRVGQAVGKQDLQGIRYASYLGMMMNFSAMIFLMLAFITIPTFFLRLDLDIHNQANALLIRDASTLMGISGILLLFDNFRLITFGALRGLKDTRYPMFASLVSFWIIGLGCAYALGFYFHLQGIGIWLGLITGIACGAGMLLLRLRYLLKRIDLNKVMSIPGTLKPP